MKLSDIISQGLAAMVDQTMVEFGPDPLHPRPLAVVHGPPQALSPAFYNKDLTLLVSFIGMPRRQKKLPCDSRIGTCSAQVWRLHGTPLQCFSGSPQQPGGWVRVNGHTVHAWSHSRYWRSPSPALAAPSGPAQPFWNKRWDVNCCETRPACQRKAKRKKKTGRICQQN